MASSTAFQPKNERNVPYTALVPVEAEWERTRETSLAFCEATRIEAAAATYKNATAHIFQVTTTVVSVILLSCTLIMVMTSSLGPKAPVFRLNSLSISNFTVSNKRLAANWVANFTVYNPNVAMELSLERIKSVIFYKEKDPLSMSSVEGFHLDFRGHNNVQIRFATTGYEGDQPIVEYPVLREIEEDKRTGALRFSMRLSMWTHYKAGYWLGWRRRFLLNPYCLDLNVGVAAEDGTWIGGEKTFCHVVVMLSDS